MPVLTASADGGKLSHCRFLKNGKRREETKDISNLRMQDRSVLNDFLDSLQRIKKERGAEHINSSCCKILNRQVQKLFPEENITASLKPIKNKCADTDGNDRSMGNVAGNKQ